MSNSPLSYKDCEELCERALSSPRGIKIVLETEQKATRYQMRLGVFRRLDRERNAKLYVEGDPLWKRSIYDSLEFRKIGPEVHIAKTSIEGLKIEELGPPEAD